MRMYRRRVCALAFALALVGVIALVLHEEEPQPTFHGKSLSYWLGAWDSGQPQRPAEKDAEDAVKSIGTNGIPFLLRRMSARDSAVANRVCFALENQHFIQHRFHFQTTEYKVASAAHAFLVLGVAADSALPEVLEILNSCKKGSAQELQIFSLFRSLGSRAHLAVPALCKRLSLEPPVAGHTKPSAFETFTEEQIRFNAALALGAIAKQPELAVPPLLNALHDPSLDVRAVAATSLGAFGIEARSALPQLKSLLIEADELLSNRSVVGGIARRHLDLKEELAEAIRRIETDSTLH